jgi:hypothetical protein
MVPVPIYYNQCLGSANFSFGLDPDLRIRNPELRIRESNKLRYGSGRNRSGSYLDIFVALKKYLVK